ncbi:MAG TPA: ATP-binding cassette domain-containing protein [Bacteroidia bacterium]|nr:ATP-binding cassette domain-containing protein [Bacteroidia bacterium]HNT79295.1 ATP-binding cassette domain-containing protein [Bacteroidia bacterium]
MMDVTIELGEVSIFQQKNLILNKVSLRIERGEFVYLIGKTGSGKSSLLRLLYGDIKPTQGTAMVAGFDLLKLKRSQIPKLRRKLGIVFQDFQLLTDRNAKDNLSFVLRATGWKDQKEIDNRISDVLAKVGLPTKGFKMPHELSGGEQQRLAVARALLNDPEIILADEPTGNLDPQTSMEIMNLLIEISKTGRSVLMATHNYNLIEKFPNRIVKCELGKVSDQDLLLHQEA